MKKILREFMIGQSLITCASMETSQGWTNNFYQNYYQNSATNSCLKQAEQMQAERSRRRWILINILSLFYFCKNIKYRKSGCCRHLFLGFRGGTCPSGGVSSFAGSGGGGIVPTTVQQVVLPRLSISLIGTGPVFLCMDIFMGFFMYVFVCNCV